MADLFDYMDAQQQNQPQQTSPPSQPPTAPPSQPSAAEPVSGSTPLQIDPRLLDRAVKRVQGLVKGNGLPTKDVTLGSDAEDRQVQMYRFKARTLLKLVPEIGIKTEAGRNTKAELVQSREDLNHTLGKIILEARTQPDKRKQIIDFMFSRSDKGFGINEQRLKFHMLTRDFVQHEKCTSCKNTGKTICTKCQGHGVTPCVNCQGRRQVVCPRCRGTAKIHQHNKLVPCDYCRADGKINCPKCAGRGQNKCQTCAASGTIQCQPCTGTGWLSQLAHVEIFAQINFDFDRTSLPRQLVAMLEKSPSRLVEKNDIEVSLKDGWSKPPPATSINQTTQQQRPEHEQEPQDTIWLDYDVSLPYGPLAFLLKERKISANLFGFQARLLDSPAFLDDLTRIGQQALLEAASGRGNTIEMLARASKYALLRDVLGQTLRLKNIQKTQNFLSSKYTTGIQSGRFEELVTAADIALRQVSRKWRISGLVAGIAAFTIITALYFPLGLRASLETSGLPESALCGIDALLLPFGAGLAVLSGKFLAKFFQTKALKGIIADEILVSSAPKAGKILWWGLSSSLLVVLVNLVFLVISQGELPVWLEFLHT